MSGMKRRVLLITEIIAPYRIPVFNALTRHEGIDLHVVFLAETDPALRQWRVYKEEIEFSYEVLKSWRYRSANHNFLINFGLSNAMKRASPEFVICGGYNYLASWQAMLWARRQQIPFALWVESTGKDLRNHTALIEALKVKFLDNCTGFIVPGKSSFAYLRNYGVPEEKIFTAPNAVDIKLFARVADAVRQSRNGHSRERYFLFVGRLVETKGVFDLLEAYRQLEPGLREQVGLVFMGEGKHREQLQSSGGSITPGTVRFPGFATRDELAAYYSLAEALVFPTLTDPWGLVVNEAMACGLPVICSDAAGCAADLIEDQCNGWIVRRGDITELACTMDKIARDRVLQGAMGARGRQRIQRFSPEACAQGIAKAVAVIGA
jgi:glycosyltransferase involved in cell wall biosynthesis